MGGEQTQNDEKKAEKKSSNEGEVRPSIRLCMIRHAESKNNEVYRNARKMFKGGTPDFDVEGWHNYVDQNRSSDPGISSDGKIQAEKLKEYLAPHLDNQASNPIQIITSPMRRTMETILPTLKELKSETDVTVNALYFESEGCYDSKLQKAVPGMNQHDINNFLSLPKEASYVGFDQDPNMGWYAHGTGAENRAQSEVRASAFYTWLLDYLDVQLQQKSHDLYDAGVALAEEADELEHDKISIRQRKRRTVVLVGHGDFMSLVLKRIVAGFSYSIGKLQLSRLILLLSCQTVFRYLTYPICTHTNESYAEHHDVPHRSAFVHYNTGITELEYFGKGRFLQMRHNGTPHLDQDTHLLTGGGLKDGWSYLMPTDKIMLYEEVSCHFADEVDSHIKEQTEALKNLYVSGKRGSFLLRTTGTNSNSSSVDDESSNTPQAEKKVKCEMVFMVKRGLKVVGCVSYDDETGILSDLAIRPSVDKGNVQKCLFEAAANHAKKSGKKEILATIQTEENKQVLLGQGFVTSTAGSKGEEFLKLVLDSS